MNSLEPRRSVRCALPIHQLHRTASPILSSKPIGVPLTSSASSETAGLMCCRNRSTALTESACTVDASGHFSANRQRP
jgi:hypothetical protein